MFCKDCRCNGECEFYIHYRELEQFLTPQQWEEFEEIRLTIPCDEFD